MREQALGWQMPFLVLKSEIPFMPLAFHPHSDALYHQPPNISTNTIINVSRYNQYKLIFTTRKPKEPRKCFRRQISGLLARERWLD